MKGSTVLLALLATTGLFAAEKTAQVTAGEPSSAARKIAYRN